MRLPRALAISLLIGATGLAACVDLGPGTSANVAVTLQQSDAALAFAAEGWFASQHAGLGAAGNISRDTVAALVIRVTSVQFLPDTGSEDADAAWESLTLDDAAVIDLLALPTDDTSPLVIVSGSVAVGNYRKVRLFVDSAAIEFKGPVSIGGAFTFAAGTVYPVEIPSGAQTGLKTDMGFTVEEGAEVHLVFAPSATFANVTATGNGRVMLSPVIRSRS